MTPEERRSRLWMGVTGAERNRDVIDAIARGTQVVITDAVVQAFRPGIKEGGVLWHRTRAKLRKAFEAAGFEVIE